MEKIKNSAVKYISIVGISFILGMIVGEHYGYKQVIDDCRILQATRIGEKVIKCTTI